MKSKEVNKRVKMRGAIISALLFIQGSAYKHTSYTDLLLDMTDDELIKELLVQSQIVYNSKNLRENDK